MNTAQPIRNHKDLENLKRYYREVCPNARNQLLVILGLNTALRISDLLGLRWRDVYLSNGINIVSISALWSKRPESIPVSISIKTSCRYFRRIRDS